MCELLNCCWKTSIAKKSGQVLVRTLRQSTPIFSRVLPPYVRRSGIKRMIRTRQTASRQLSRTPWTLRRRRRTWRARRIKAARSSTGCSEPWSKRLRQPCDDGSCWKEQPINLRLPQSRLRRLPWTPTMVRLRRSLALSERLFGLLPASTGACAIRTVICRRRTKFTFLRLVRQQVVPQQKEEETWIYSIVLQATTPGTRGVCWSMQVL